MSILTNPHSSPCYSFYPSPSSPHSQATWRRTSEWSSKWWTRARPTTRFGCPSFGRPLSCVRRAGKAAAPTTTARRRWWRRLPTWGTTAGSSKSTTPWASPWCTRRWVGCLVAWSSCVAFVCVSLWCYEGISTLILLDVKWACVFVMLFVFSLCNVWCVFSLCVFVSSCFSEVWKLREREFMIVWYIYVWRQI